jgi:EAL domain-containing protein (putative c-di-GMP-specific phosphodiesterase class I)/CheY-like chemotaxis protein
MIRPTFRPAPEASSSIPLVSHGGAPALDTIRVLIADDEPRLRGALADLIASEETMLLVGSAGDAEEAITLAEAIRPDVAIVDVKMPAGGGPRAARGIMQASPETRVIALSAHDDRETVHEMLRAGAVSYLVKGTAPDEIVRSIGRAAQGQTSLSTEVMDGIVHELSSQLRREEDATVDRLARQSQIRRLIDGEGIEMHFQPIVDLATGATVGAEALARFVDDLGRPPNEVFREAAEVGLGVELELTAIRMALAEVGYTPAGTYISVNASHRVAMHAGLLELLDEAPVERLVVEITEHEPVEDYDALISALRVLRGRGVRIAIDDAGAGFSSLRHTLRLEPDIVKLDISITRGIDADRGRRALASAMISFADEMEMTIVAEGIETRAEHALLRELGVPYGQGYLFARPARLLHA